MKVKDKNDMDSISSLLVSLLVRTRIYGSRDIYYAVIIGPWQRLYIYKKQLEQILVEFQSVIF